MTEGTAFLTEAVFCVREISGNVTVFHIAVHIPLLF